MTKMLTMLLTILCLQGYAYQLTVQTPNGGECYHSGQPLTIVWSGDVPDSLKIELAFNAMPDSTGSGNYLITESATDSGFYQWLIPEWLPSSSTYKIKISSLSGSLFDYSDSSFTILQDSLTDFISVVLPNDSSSFSTNQQILINWSDNITEDVRIDLLNFTMPDSTSFDSTYYGCYIIADSTDSDGEYLWSIPDSLPAGQQYAIRVSSILNPAVSSQSSCFAISRMLESIKGDAKISAQLMQNYPNPFNPSTTISFLLQKSVIVRLSVYNACGELVKTIHKGLLPAGMHKMEFDGNGINSGMYFYKLETPEASITQKMLLVK